MNPRSRELPSTAVTAIKASSMTAKYSGAPREIANRVTIGAKKASSSVPIVPATHEPDRGGGQCLRGPATLGHQVALDRGDH
jgi:hypothetical protein